MLWKTIRYRIEWAGVKALVSVIPRLPRRTCAVLARWVGRLVFVIDRKGRRVTLANIEAALGDQYTKEQQFRIGQESYEYFARTMLDLFWAPALNRPGGEKYVDVVGIENLERLRGKPVVVVVAHFAGFEWTGIGPALKGITGSVLTQEFKNPLLDKLFTDLRSCTGQTVITRQMSMLRMLRQVKKGNYTGMLVDLNLPPTQAATVIETFGMKMCATYLHAILAQRAGASLVPVTSHPRADGSCLVEIHEPLVIPPNSTGQQIAQIAWDFYEAVIRKNPEMWMWVYKHWRFRPKGDTHPYPFYANESGKFEKLVREIGQESGRTGQPGAAIRR